LIFFVATINVNDEKEPPWLSDEKELNSTPPPILTAGTVEITYQCSIII
jgi:hypothetical protein